MLKPWYFLYGSTPRSPRGVKRCVRIHLTCHLRFAHWWVYYILTIYAHQACPLHKRCIALHCNDSYFHSKWPFFQTWPNWLKRLIYSAFNQNGQVWKKRSSWVKIAVIAMNCNASSMKGTSLVRIYPYLSMCGNQQCRIINKTVISL